jgi:hypothetical protein
MKVLSLGWGVQSFTLAAMVALGELEPIDYAIHADTTHESQLTYAFARKWTPWLEERGVKVVTVREERATQELGKDSIQTHLPVYTMSDKGVEGQALRSCTGRWKIAPMRRWYQTNRNGERIEQLIGISLDEAQRMRDSDVQYISNIYPLIDKRMRRGDCINWLEYNVLEIPARSACTFCPFHSSAEWHRIKQTPEDWAEAVTVDRKIRKARPPYDLFVHPSRKPLEEVDFRTAEEKGQLSLWDAECSGICGV